MTKVRRLQVRSRRLRWAVAFACLLGGLSFTHAFYAVVSQESHSRFEAESRDIAGAIQARIQAYSDVLYALRGLFDTPGIRANVTLRTS